MRIRIANVLAILLGLCSALTLHAQCKPISAVPYTITSPGTYCVTGDLTSTYLNAAAIYIGNVSNVTVDLGGFRVTTTGIAGIGVYAYGASNLVIRHGQITAGHTGVQVDAGSSGASNVVVEDLVIDGVSHNGVAVTATSSAIHDVYVHAPKPSAPSNTADYGIYASGVDIDHVHVEGPFAISIYSYSTAYRTIRNASLSGGNNSIYIQGGGAADVVNCDLTNVLNDGVAVLSGDATIVGCRISAPYRAIAFYNGAGGRYRDNVFVSSKMVSGSGTNLGNNT